MIVNLKENVIAIIPARSGSKGVPGKNIALLGGYPLIAYSIAAAKLSGIDRVLVSTDSEEYALITRRYGAETPFVRPDEISSDQSTDFEFMRHAIDWMIRARMDSPAGGDVDDGASTGFRHQGNSCAANAKGCFDVDGEGGGVVIVCRFGDRAPADDTRVVDDDV